MSSRPADFAVRIRDLRKDYFLGGEAVHVLQGIDLEVPVGDYVAIMGPSGSGKSTLLNLLGCLDQITSGDFELAGEDVSSLDDDRLAEIRARHIGFVFQSYNLITTLTVQENIESPLFYAGQFSERDRRRGHGLAREVGLGDRLDHRPSELSGGQQQRAGIARCLINNPKFILADEATGNLDSVTTEEILDLFDKLNAEGRTIIMVTHEEEVALRARRIVRLKDGVVQSDVRNREIEAPAAPAAEAVEEEKRRARQKKAAGSLRGRIRRFTRPWSLGVKNLYLHPMRSLLTVLGIFIGVASVIWLLAIGEGISAKAQEEIARLGATNVIVTSVPPPRDPKNPYNRLYGVTKAEVEMLTETVSSIERAVPTRTISRADFKFSGRTVQGPLKGVTESFQDLQELEILQGRFLTATDLLNEAKVCVVGESLAEQLFPYENPIGKSIHLANYSFADYYLVVGVVRTSLEADAASLLIPISTYWRNIYDFYSRSEEGEPTVSDVTFQVGDQEAVLETAQIIRTHLDRTHVKDDFEVLVPLELLERAQNTRVMFIAMLGLVAAISLVVGGIGIMNIMLATVTERTREIGIRRALGAKKNDITRQFLVETIVLSVVGGLVGIMAGFLAKPATIGLRAVLLSSFPELMEDAPESIMTMVPIVVPWSIPLAFGISVLVGVVFGLYPAGKAASMNPIDALRHVN